MPDVPAPVVRERLSTVELSGSPDRIEGYRVTMAPGHLTGLHHHPGGVVGVVTGGTVLFEYRGEVRVLKAGDAFTEAPGATVERFDNASASEPATFIAYYTLRDDALIVPGAGPSK